MKKYINNFIFATSILALSSCAKDGDNIDAEALKDLQKVANVVETFSLDTDLPENNTSNKASSRNHSDIITTGLNIIEIDEQSNDKTEHSIFQFFQLDGTTPLRVSEAYSVGNYIVKGDIYYRNALEESNILITTETNTETIDNIKYVNANTSGTGTINYYNDDLIFNIKSFTGNITVADGTFSENATFEYDVSFFDNKYGFLLSFDLSIEDLRAIINNPDPTVIVSTSDIVNKNNIKVGTFILYQDDSVKILDEAGNTLEPQAE